MNSSPHLPFPPPPPFASGNGTAELRICTSRGSAGLGLRGGRGSAVAIGRADDTLSDFEGQNCQGYHTQTQEGNLRLERRGQGEQEQEEEGDVPAIQIELGISKRETEITRQPPHLI